MIVGEKGPLSQTQVDKMEADARETKRVKTLSLSNIEGEVRARMKGENLLGFALGTAILAALFQNERDDGIKKFRQFLPGNDPYCLMKPHRAKMGRMRKGKVATKTPVAGKVLPIAA